MNDNHKVKEWTEEEISLLIKLWTQGNSGSEIGKILCRSKGSVIGKIHRMNYTRKSVEVSKSVFGEPKKLEDLQANECRWPIGQGKNMLFCSAKTVSGKSYCEKHYKIAHRKSEPKPYLFV